MELRIGDKLRVLDSSGLSHHGIVISTPFFAEPMVAHNGKGIGVREAPLSEFAAGRMVEIVARAGWLARAATSCCSSPCPLGAWVRPLRFQLRALRQLRTDGPCGKSAASSLGARNADRCCCRRSCTRVTGTASDLIRHTGG